MDYSSALGPIDPQVMAPDGGSYLPALGYLDKVEEITAKPQLTPADVVLLKGIDLGRLALFEQAKNLSIDLLKNGWWNINSKTGRTIAPIMRERWLRLMRRSSELPRWLVTLRIICGGDRMGVP